MGGGGLDRLTHVMEGRPWMLIGGLFYDIKRSFSGFVFVLFVFARPHGKDCLLEFS